MADTKNYNRATKFFRDMEFADAYDDRWGKFADAMDEVISMYALVVRCKDCIHRDPEDFKCDCGHDIHWELPRPDDWFCADGEKKQDE